jgi:chorismate mutase
MLSDKTIQEINRHTDPSSLLAVTVEKLKRIHTPFPVKCVKSVGNIQEGQVVLVDEVSVSRKYSLIYKIRGSYYAYSFFYILD